MLPQRPDKDGLDKKLIFGTEKIYLTTFPSDCQLISSKWGTPALSAANKFTPSLASTASYASSKTKSEATLSAPGRTELHWICVAGYLIFPPPPFSFCLSLISPWFINNCSAAKKQFINCSQRKVKLSKEPVSSAPSLFLFSRASAGRWSVPGGQAGRQAGGQAGRRAGEQPPCPPLRAGGWLARRLQGSYNDICQLRIWPRPPERMPALLVSTASGCGWVLRSQPETFLFRLIHFITFMTEKIYSSSAPVLKGGVQDLWITRNVLQQKGHSACFAM